jgi:ribosomal protein S18 acetylase RimI-like enzyme
LVTSENKLDNPVWYSLSEGHSDLAIQCGEAKFYPPEYCLFGGYATAENLLDSMIQYSALSPNFFIAGKKPDLPTGFLFEHQVDSFQMQIVQMIDIPITEVITELTGDHIEDVLELVAIAYPNFFLRKTLFLGKNFGIYKNGKLVAMTGERMKMDLYTEVSAVITHPDHTRRGYAKQLVAHTVNHIFNENKTPYLHVAKSNTKAISLYKSLGFFLRKEITYWGIKKEY